MSTLRSAETSFEMLIALVLNRRFNCILSPMFKNRHHFVGIKQTAVSWSECPEALDHWCADEWGRQRHVEEEMADQKPEGEHRRQIHSGFAAKLSAEQAEIQDARASAHQKLLTELRRVPVRVRLAHIARDDTRSPSSYPADLAVCIAEDLKQLELITRERLVAKLHERKKSSLHKLAERLGLDRTESKGEA